MTSVSCLFCSMQFTCDCTELFVRRFLEHYNQHIQKQLTEIKQDNCQHDFVVCSKCGVMAEQ